MQIWFATRAIRIKINSSIYIVIILFLFNDNLKRQMDERTDE